MERDTRGKIEETQRFMLMLWAIFLIILYVCSLKVYRAESVKDIRLFGEMHRYITALLTWKGYRVGEIKVNHRARKHGKTKYSMSRLFKGFMDLILVWFWQKYSNRPIHVFGFLGLSVGFMGFVAGMISIYLKIMQDVD